MAYFVFDATRSIDTANIPADAHDRNDSIVTVHDTDGKLFDVWAFQTPQDANAKKLELKRAAGDGGKFDVVFVATYTQRTEWTHRERQRFTNGEYTKTPWHHMRHHYPLHFAHLSVKQKGLIAYTVSDEHGIADRQTQIKPTKYLMEFYGRDSQTAIDNVPVTERLTDEQIAEYVAEITATINGEIKFTSTSAEAVKAYVNGPRSCMSRPAHAYKGHVHPAAVYGGEYSDLVVAYTGDLDTVVTARCVVWPEKQIAVRIYPDDQSAAQTALAHALRTQGYRIYKRDTCDGVIDGARFAAIEDQNNHGWIVGYVDGCSDAFLTRDEKSFVVGRRDERCESRSLSINTGLTQDWNGDVIALGVSDARAIEPDEPDYDFVCDNCNNEYSDDDRSEHDRSLCTDCASEIYCDCDACGDTIDTRDDDCQRVRTANRYRYVNLCQSCYDDRHHECDRCSNTWVEGYQGDTSSTDHGRDGTLCESCADDYVTCEHCDKHTERNDSEICSECDRPYDGSEKSDDDDQPTLPIDRPLDSYRVELRGDADTDDPTGRKWTPCYWPTTGDTFVGNFNPTDTAVSTDIVRLVRFADHMRRTHSRRCYRVWNVTKNRVAMSSIDWWENPNGEIMAIRSIVIDSITAAANAIVATETERS